jgi:hypothetical protein
MLKPVVCVRLPLVGPGQPGGLEQGEKRRRSPLHPSSTMSLPPAIPWRVALQQSSPPLHRLAPVSSRQPHL